MQQEKKLLAKKSQLHREWLISSQIFCKEPSLPKEMRDRPDNVRFPKTHKEVPNHLLSYTQVTYEKE